MDTVAIDPGLRGCGVALFSDTRLTWAGYVAPSISSAGNVDTRLALETAAAVAAEVNEHLGLRGVYDLRAIIEWPQVYQRGGGKSKGDPNVLLPLAGIDLAVAAYLRIQPENLFSVTPAGWKGQVEKTAMAHRIMGRLEDKEAWAIVDPGKSLLHNVIDAVGVGLWAMHRLEPQKAIHR